MTTTQPRRKKSLQEHQLNWKIRFRAAYCAQLPTALVVGLLVTAAAVVALQSYIGLNAVLGLGVMVMLALPVLALGPTLASLEPYPTAAQHAKTNRVIDMHADMERQELGASPSTAGNKQLAGKRSTSLFCE